MTYFLPFAFLLTLAIAVLFGFSLSERAKISSMNTTTMEWENT